MIIMAAGMHDPPVFRAEGKSCLLLYLQGIHIRPESCGGTGQSSGKLGNYTVSSHALTDLKSADIQKLPHNSGGCLFLVS